LFLDLLTAKEAFLNVTYLFAFVRFSTDVDPQAPLDGVTSP